MAETLKSFLQFLDSEKAVQDMQGTGAAMRSFARPLAPSIHATRLAQSYIVETRVAVVERNSAQIWWVGEIVRSGGSVEFKPWDQLTDDIVAGNLRCAGLFKQLFDFDLKLPETHKAEELFEAIATAVLEKDPGLEKSRATKKDEGAMQAIWQTFGAAIHDQLCRRVPMELETIGTFMPVEQASRIQFLPDEHLLGLIAPGPGRMMTPTEMTPRSIAQAKSPSGRWHFLDDERDLYPSDDDPSEGLVRDLYKTSKDS